MVAISERTDLDATERKQLAFAKAYFDPTSATFGKMAASYIAAVDPNAKQATAAKQAKRYIESDIVKEYEPEFAKMPELMGAVSVDEYENRMWRHEERMLMLAAKGVPGAAQAAVKYAELAGRVRQFFVHVIRDDTPKEPQQLLPTSPADWEALERRIAMAKMLSLPNPKPSPVAVVKHEIVEAEIVSDLEEENESE